MNKVITGHKYTFHPVPLDRINPFTDLQDGEIVRVVNKFGCPPANTMGHCFVERLDGKFCGLVCTNSLVKE